MLVVEDDAPIRTLLTVVLARAGFEVDAVADGHDALTLLSTVSYSSVVLDLFMHGTSGRDVLDEIAVVRPAVLRHTVVVSAAPGPELDDVVAQYRGVRVIRKPFELEELVDAIRAAAAGARPVARDLASEFCRRSVLLGAHAGIVVKAPSEGGPSLDLVTSFGYPSETIGRYLPISIDAPLPLCKSFALGHGIWLSSVTTATSEYPLLSSIWQVAEAQALATLPIKAGGRTIGAVGWAFRQARAFEPDHRAAFEDIASFVSSALPATIRSAAS